MFKKISAIFSSKKLNQIAQRVLEKIEGKDVDMSTFLIPPAFRRVFEIERIKEKPKEFNIVLREKSDQIPEEACGKNLIRKGFLDKVEVITFPIYEKAVYIRYYRRRWRDKDTGKDYFNTYEFHPSGVKATHEFAFFLKETDRDTLDALCFDWKDIRYIRKEDFYVV